MFLTSEINCLGHVRLQGQILNHSQSKMKARYDKHSVDRKFEPGDKVPCSFANTWPTLTGKILWPRILLIRKQVI